LAFVMRITCCVSALLCITAACSNPPRSNPAARDTTVVLEARSENTQTRLELQVGQDRRSVLLERDGTVAPDPPPPKVDVVANLPGLALIVTDAYPSLAGGLSYCQAGEERFLRVISIANGGAAGTLVAKLASCRDNLELADPGLQWEPQISTLHIHWLRGPSGTAEDRTIVIASDGTATLSSR
jgi:hypothetical protein